MVRGSTGARAWTGCCGGRVPRARQHLTIATAVIILRGSRRVSDWDGRRSWCLSVCPSLHTVGLSICVWDLTIN
jgi:hypothetical protein